MLVCSKLFHGPRGKGLRIPGGPWTPVWESIKQIAQFYMVPLPLCSCWQSRLYYWSGLIPFPLPWIGCSTTAPFSHALLKRHITVSLHRSSFRPTKKWLATEGKQYFQTVISLMPSVNQSKASPCSHPDDWIDQEPWLNNLAVIMHIWRRDKFYPTSSISAFSFPWRKEKPWTESRLPDLGALRGWTVDPQWRVIHHPCVQCSKWSQYLRLKELSILTGLLCSGVGEAAFWWMSEGKPKWPWRARAEKTRDDNSAGEEQRERTVIKTSGELMPEAEGVRFSIKEW